MADKPAQPNPERAPAAPSTPSASPGNARGGGGGGGGGSAPPGAGLLPSLSLPKGGGAIRGIGEKFSTNPATGTGSLSIPLATSPGRAGFELGLQLSYDSGGGNGPFGIGWGLSVPAVTRKTDQGLPRYADSADDLPDVFVMSGAEDLVPVRLPSGGGGTRPDIVERGDHRVERYRPRTEGLYARIERWTHAVTGDIHWRATTKDNVLSVYGRTAQARIADPEHAVRVFSWLLEETRDDRGNVVRYSYKAEDGAGVAATEVQQAHRFDPDSGGAPVYRATAQRYLKRIQYGNRTPLLDREAPLPTAEAAYLFEAVLDYGEHADDAPAPAEVRPWPLRQDAFSQYRAGFEVRTQRLCRRALMFHRFAELGPTACLVRSTDFTHEEGPVVTYLTGATQTGYLRNPDGVTYQRAELPTLQLGYARATVHDRLQTVEPDSLAGIRGGIEGTGAQWADLDGEGIAGVLIPTERAWYYKPNLGEGRLAPPSLLRSLPSPAELGEGGQQLTDLDGDGHLELVSYTPPLAGFFPRTAEDGWAPFRALPNLPAIDWNDPNLRFLDLDGDGFADVLITEHEAFVWYRSRAKDGFDPPVRIAKPHDEREGPDVVFADGTETIQLADLSGDGLSDLVRVRNGEVCYWPNLGHGHFGRRVTLKLSAAFDDHAHFDARRVRFADLDGSGPSDVVYLHRDGVRLYFNHAGNALAAPVEIRSLPPVDPLSSVGVTDLLGRGTSCLVWSSPLPGNHGRPLAYVDLMGGQKPHLLESIVNNLGAETRMAYASSTKFYLQDKAAGKPWLTRLAFPVHVIERIERYDHIARSRLVTRFAYHHGYFDGVEREFHGFGCTEQWDAESFGGGDAAATTASLFPELAGATASEQDPALELPPVRTVTWFHTGAWLEREALERALAKGYYQGDPLAPLLPDTILPMGLSVREEREAARALRGQILRQEIYAEDGTPAAAHPYTVSERNHEVRLVQRAEGAAQGDDRRAVNAVFFVHPRHTLELHYERDPGDPRIQHELVLEVDDFGNTLRAATIAYPRRVPVEPEQARLWATFTEAVFANRPNERDWYRVGAPIETITRELTGLTMPAQGVLSVALVAAKAAFATDIPYEAEPDFADPIGQRRVIEHERRFYYRDDLGGPLPLGQLGPRALPHETYKLALTPGLLAQVYGDRVTDAMLINEGGYVFDAGGWWAPAGHVVYDPAQFFLPIQAIDPFGQRHTLRYDAYALLPLDVEDPLHNRVTSGTRNAAGSITANGNDYRVLAPALLTDPNRNRTAVAFDVRGMVVASAVMGKEGELLGDLLEGFPIELPLATKLAFLADPHTYAAALLGSATSRLVYDLDRFGRAGQPPLVATMMRETHVHDVGGAASKIQIAFSYSDGFGRELQKKMQAEAGEAPQRLPPAPLPGGDLQPGELVRDAQGRPVLAATPRRWVGSGRTVFNNKGKPVKQYEPFFSSTPLYERERELTDTGVSPVLFYDPVERVVATLHPNHAYEKVAFDAWQETTHDVNDTVLSDPRTDEDIRGYVADYFAAQPSSWKTWYAQRIDGQLGTAEREAAQKAAAHAGTPTTARIDSMGRKIVTLAKNRFDRGGVTIEETYATRVRLDVENNQRAVTDARGRVVMRYRHDLLSQQLTQASMEAGERWLLSDVSGKPVRAWDSRGFVRRMTYDALRRPLGLYVTESGPGGMVERLAERTGYGEGIGEATNHRTRVHQVFDGAGVVTSLAYDFKGNLRAGRREMLANYKTAVDWSQNPVANDGTFDSSLTYDALNRPVTSTSPDGSVQRSVFNEANLLEQIHVNLRGAATATTFVTNIDYDAKGQRSRIAYGNGAVTNYSYDPLTFRLLNLRTTRPPVPDTIASQLFRDPTVVQDLRYVYDPTGNITQIEDASLRVVFYDNQQVEPISRYTYDAVYRLIEAQGREHIGQNAFDFAPSDGNYRDYPFVGNRVNPNDAQALRNYLQRYEYDEVGNFLVFRHLAGGSGWTRRYEYQEPSLLEPGVPSNRLSRTVIGGSGNHVEQYTYDAHGNMTSMPHLASMSWDFKDQLRSVNLGGGGTAYYVYDAAGQRTRKVIESLAGVRQKQRLYLGSFENYREYDGSSTGPTSERESLSLFHGDKISSIDTATIRNGLPISSPTAHWIYLLSNHQHSNCIELDMNGELVSLEEYHPYGTASFQPGRSSVDVSIRRYRYTCKERDEETSTSNHGSRQLAPWLGRWISCDPKMLIDGTNLYSFTRMNPTTNSDPTGNQSQPPASSRAPTVHGPLGLRHTYSIDPTTGKAKHERLSLVQRQAGHFIRRQGQLSPTSTKTIQQINNPKDAEPLIKFALEKLQSDAASFQGNFPGDYYVNFGKAVINESIRLHGPDDGIDKAQEYFGSEVDESPSAAPFHVFESIARRDANTGWDKVQHFVRSATTYYNHSEPTTDALQYSKEVWGAVKGLWDPTESFDWNDMLANNRGQAFGHKLFDKYHPVRADIYNPERIVKKIDQSASKSIREANREIRQLPIDLENEIYKLYRVPRP